ncbi:MAG TPA: sigma-54-dependent Fis family transcriptional regulator [Microscillaceae bacterium]|jgi:DNA-binding NtrC family response regulator|nr:sigma-54-dependent Fis family transcriptional regulator [Microscillaceae bacterium]
MKSTVLIIDDETKLRSLLARIINLEDNLEAIEAADAQAGLKLLETKEIELVICDVKLPDKNGVALTEIIKKKHPSVEIILLTAYGNIPDGVQAIKNGAFDYLTKGDDHNKILPTIYRALEKVALTKRVYNLEQQVGRKFGFEQILGNSPKMLAAVELAKKVAPTDTTVLLLGETGTGKEVFAQAIHQESSRKQKPIVALNCAAFSKDLLESELFGHRSGAFTGALKDKKGLVQEAHQGTLFLDELGEMPLDLQAKILRFLETGEFYIIGDTKPSKVNVRLVAATNKDLKQLIEQQQFRSDLFYRLSVFQITLPPLRERVKDIKPLAEHFLQAATLKIKKKIHCIEPDYLKALQNYNFAGNLRELKNIIERSVILSTRDTLHPETLPIDLIQASLASASRQANDAEDFTLSSLEKKHILQTLQRTQGNKTETARLLGIAPSTLYRKMADYGLM